MREFLILLILFSFGSGGELSLSAKEKRAMKDDYNVLDKAFTAGYTEHVVEFSKIFLEKYKLASVDKDQAYRNLYNAVKNALEYFQINTENNYNTEKNTENNNFPEDIDRLFKSVMLGSTQDILVFAEKYPDFRTKDLLGVIERARISDIILINNTLSKYSIPVKQIREYANNFPFDTLSLAGFRDKAEKLIEKNHSLLHDYRITFGYNKDFEEKIERLMFRNILTRDWKEDLIMYMELFPDGKNIASIHKFFGLSSMETR
jgi:hypothetical protein